MNDKLNVSSAINHYNAKHIKDNIYEAKAKGNYFRLVTLKTMHPNKREFCPCDIVGTLDKQCVLAGYHSFVECGQRKNFFLTPHQPTTLDTTTPTCNRT